MSMPKEPCKECPWRRKAAAGWLGPYTPEEWVALAHSDERIACHMTIPENDEGEGDWERDEAMQQCKGAAIYRRNVGKLPRDREVEPAEADRDTVFASPLEFKEHHEL